MTNLVRTLIVSLTLAAFAGPALAGKDYDKESPKEAAAREKAKTSKQSQISPKKDDPDGRRDKRSQ